jgi:hypothetical protein
MGKEFYIASGVTIGIIGLVRHILWDIDPGFMNAFESDIADKFSVMRSDMATGVLYGMENSLVVLDNARSSTADFFFSWKTISIGAGAVFLMLLGGYAHHRFSDRGRNENAQSVHELRTRKIVKDSDEAPC